MKLSELIELNDEIIKAYNELLEKKAHGKNSFTNEWFWHGQGPMTLEEFNKFEKLQAFS